VAKVLLIVAAFGAAANTLAKVHSEPPLLIDSHPAHATIDAAD
jgi:hypothetical protein